MYAIVRTGGKQYRVQPGDLVRVEKLERDLGTEFDLTEVLMVGGDKTYVGQPLVNNAKVTVVVTQQAKDAKIVVFKKRRRQGYRKTQGHRQLFTELFVKSITSPEGQTSAADKKFTVVDPAKKAERLAKQAEKKAAAPKVKKADKKVAKKAPAKKAAPKKAAAKKGGAKKSGASKAKAKKTTTAKKAKK
jgi:large subunit ribosomal protein L21